jgi:two-component system, cell cycle response regulator DivK
MSNRILVVEDQEDNRQIIRDMLSTTDYEIIEAESGVRRSKLWQNSGPILF